MRKDVLEQQDDPLNEAGRTIVPPLSSGSRHDSAKRE
jgi:hypothetical protein